LTIKFRGVQEVADELGVDVQTVRRWIHAGNLRAFKPGKEYRIRESDLEEFLRAREVHPKAARRSPFEPTFNDVIEEERRAEEVASEDEPLLSPIVRRIRRDLEAAHRRGDEGALKTVFAEIILLGAGAYRAYVEDSEDGPELRPEFKQASPTYQRKIVAALSALSDMARELGRREGVPTDEPVGAITSLEEFRRRKAG
jgi:excisionase family DNA binding protein